MAKKKQIELPVFTKQLLNVRNTWLGKWNAFRDYCSSIDYLCYQINSYDGKKAKVIRRKQPGYNKNYLLKELQGSMEMQRCAWSELKAFAQYHFPSEPI